VSLTALDLFAARASEQPANIAVSGAGGDLTYADLRRAAAGTARRLADAGMRPGFVVAVMTGSCLELVPALLGVMQAGAVYVPLDPAYPDQRLAGLLTRLRPAAIITRGHLYDRVQDVARRADVATAVLTCDDHESTIAGSVGGAVAPRACPVADLPGRRHPPRPAYVFFTSGSQGTPKGVLGCATSLGHFVAWEARAFAVTEADRFSQLGAVSSDASLKDILVPLAAGARVCVPPEPLAGAALLDWVSREAITVLGCVPALFRTLLEAAVERGERAATDLAALRLVLLAGETLKVPWVQQWMDLCGRHTPIANLYGATEATVYSTYHLVTERPPEGTRMIPVGRPIDAAEVLVVNPGGHLCVPGEVGEIYLRTPFLSLGYFDDQEATSGAFVQHPLGDIPETVYRTGDMGRILPDGALEFIGRRDGQVKVRGHRVELGEVERTLAAHPSLREAVVTAREDERDGSRLVAYAVPRSDTAPDSAELRAWLSERLPSYMVPGALLLLDRLPLTHNGKIDRRALPDPGPAGPAAGEGTVAPRTPVEETVAAVWCELLERDTIGVHDGFFDLGGHSLLAMQAVSRLRDAFGIDLPLRRLFDAPTVAGLAAAIAEAQKQGTASALPAITPVPRDGALPLSFNQRRLWFLDRLAPGDPAYNIHAALHLRGPLDIAALERALNEVVRRHESLRTTFVEEGGLPVQRIAPELALPLTVHDLSDPETAAAVHGPAPEPPPGAFSPHARESEALRLAEAEAMRPFDLARGPLLRTSLLRLAPDEHIALLAIHHIVADRWSCDVLVRELAAIYGAHAGAEAPRALRAETGRTSAQRPSGEAGAPVLPPLPVQYADFAVWQRRQVEERVLPERLPTLLRRLAGVAQASPLLNGRPGGGAHVEHLLPATLRDQALAFSHGERATLFMTLLAGFDALLHALTGRTDVVIGTDVAGRPRPETEGLIGFFVNQLALRVDLSGNPTFRALLARAREVALEGYACQDVPFDRLVEALNPARGTDRAPLFRAKLVLQNAPLRDLALTGIAVEPLPVEKPTAQQDFNLRITETAAGLACSVEYNTGVFGDGEVAAFLERFETLLTRVVAGPDLRLDDLCAGLAGPGAGPWLAADGGALDRDIAQLARVRRRPVRIGSDTQPRGLGAESRSGIVGEPHGFPRAVRGSRGHSPRPEGVGEPHGFPSSKEGGM
jgi:amino acid adenylation domain-containing protein